MLKFWNFHEFLRITLKFNFARPRPPTLYNPNEFLTFLSPGIAKSDFPLKVQLLLKVPLFVKMLGISQKVVNLVKFRIFAIWASRTIGFA